MRTNYLELNGRLTCCPIWRKGTIGDMLRVTARWALWAAFRLNEKDREREKIFIDWEHDHEFNQEFLDQFGGR